MPKGVSVIYSDKELTWLESNRDLPRKDLHAKFVKKFSRPEVKADSIRNLMTRRGWARTSYRFTAEELEWIQGNVTLSAAELHRQFVEKFNRPSTTKGALACAKHRRGWLTGRKGGEGLVQKSCFKPGHTPANKGVPMKPEVRKKVERTMFKKGSVPANQKYFGYERVDKDGYVLISIDEPCPWTNRSRRQVHKHKYLWEKANGPVPKGHCLKCLDSNKENTDPSNWICISRGVAARLSGKSGRDYDNAPPHLKPTILAAAQLAQKVYKLRKGEDDE